MILDRERSIVVVIDLQGKLLDLVHRSGLVIEGTLRLLDLASLFDVPVVLTEQYPAGLGPTHPRILEAFDALPVEKRRVEKDCFGCCEEPLFLEALEQLRPVSNGPRQVVVAGIEAHVCVMQTTLGLLDPRVLGASGAGSEVHLCWECVSGRGEEYREWALQRMQQGGATVTNHESVAFEWARDKNHPSFKAVNRLLREGQLS